VLERWLDVRKPGAGAWISLRGPLRAVPHWILGIDIHYFVWLPELLPARSVGLLTRRFREPMTGTRIVRALWKGSIGRKPEVQTYRDDVVSFIDGSSMRPDLVVFATGFRYAAAHLGELVAREADGMPTVKNCESTRTPNLFLLGVRFGKTLGSAYLRGISRDAKYLAAKIEAQ
jgi:putative flavoprotein involved in K+ transport